MRVIISRDVIFNELEIPCLKDNTITNNHSCDPSPSSISVEVETISEPTLEPPQEPETNFEPSATSSSSPIPKASDPILDGSNEEEEHPEAQTQALRNYQLARDRVRRVHKDHPRTPVPETSDPIIDGFDEEEEHPEAQTQALRDYQLARDRVRRVPKDHSWYGFSYIKIVSKFSMQLCKPVTTPLASHLNFPTKRILKLNSSLSPCLSDGEKDRGSRLPVISSRLRPVSEGYNPNHHFSSLLTPRRGNATARCPILVW
ncbi:hypothetical protein M9H77_11076 [Catharanthus roseus]|uniref:Uncharacterized protein n=1 Tax=Catharanthus roseus TaxID=4058 RepID=A0ACC0BDK8_CATRO|nr:hypothetical protein M9H77_11076 [Catharanthus roseus]